MQEIMTSDALLLESIHNTSIRGTVTGLFDSMTSEEEMIRKCFTIVEQDLAYGLIMTNWIWEHEGFDKGSWLNCYAELLTKRPKKQETFDKILNKHIIRNA